MAISQEALDYAAFDMWLMGEGEDNRAELDKMKRILPIVLSECCTKKQRAYITHYFVNKMTVCEIATLYGIDHSTVSKTIKRGLNRAYKYLRFASPLFIKQPQHRGYLKGR